MSLQIMYEKALNKEYFILYSHDPSILIVENKKRKKLLKGFLALPNTTLHAHFVTAFAQGNNTLFLEGWANPNEIKNSFPAAGVEGILISPFFQFTQGQSSGPLGPVLYPVL